MQMSTNAPVRWLLAFALFALSSFAVPATAIPAPENTATEFCPATLADAGLTRVGPAGSTLFRYGVAANGARSARGSVIAYSNAGWFVFSFPLVPIAERVDRFDTGQVKFSRTSFQSPQMFVTFPAGAEPTDAFVSSASSTGDALFGWDAKGTVTCPAQSGFRMKPRTATEPASPKIVDLTPDPNVTPGRESIRSVAASTSAPGPLDCAVPFADAKATSVIPPEFPSFARGVMETAGSTFTLVRLMVGPDGRLAEPPVVWVPSVSPALDQSALRAARLSKYSAGKAFCAPAAGEYIFHASFRSN